MITLARNPLFNWQAQIKSNTLKGAILFSVTPSKTVFFKLNPLGAAIWIMLEGRKTSDEIVSDLKKKYPTVISSQINAFIEKLSQRDFVLPGQSPSFIDIEPLAIKSFTSPQIKEIILSNKNINWHRDIMTVLRRRFNKEQLFYPLKINFDITHNCNLKCKHCYYYEDNGKTSSEDLPTDQVKEIIDAIKKAHVSIINLFGGEPFIRKDLAQIIEYIYQNQMRVVINSNGTLINNLELEIIQKYNCSVHISLDGATSLTHNKIRGRNNLFEKTTSTVQRAAKLGIPIQLNFTANHININEIFKIPKLAKNIGVENVAISTVTKLGRTHADNSIWLTFYDRIKFILFFIFAKTINFLSLKKIPHINFIKCDAFSYTHIDAQGNVSFCVRAPNSLAKGNIFKTDLLSIWHSREYRRQFDFHLIKGLCHECLFKNLCTSPGCRIEVYSLTGDFHGTVEKCYRGKISRYIRMIQKIFTNKKS